jgi:stage II sporulation protein D
MRYLFFLLFQFLILQVFCQTTLKVGIYTTSTIKSAEITLNGEDASLEIGKDLSFFSSSKDEKFLLVPEGRHIVVYLNSFPIGRALEIKIKTSAPSNCFYKPVRPDLRGNNYSGVISIKNSNGKLFAVNELDTDIYLAGVLRGEIGFDKPIEVYKMHAIMSRTYAMHYMNRHKSEGFNVCDQTHCQVYKGWFDYSPFHEAISSTSGRIVLNKGDNNAAECLFHSNCGGITNSSEQVWSARLPYCRTVVDSFCRTSKNSSWIKRFTLSEFNQKLKIPLSKQVGICDSICLFQDRRAQTINFNGVSYDLIYLRNTLDLKSTWFNWECINDTVLITGRGYGHGVGVCQEGAIKMAELGYSAEEILHYYYSNIRISDAIKEKENGLFPD